MRIEANGIAVEAEDTGARDDGRPAVLLVMGLGMQLIAWPAEFVRALVDAGLRVIRFDNRDIGRSQHFDQFVSCSANICTLVRMDAGMIGGWPERVQTGRLDPVRTTAEGPAGAEPFGLARSGPHAALRSPANTSSIGR